MTAPAPKKLHNIQALRGLAALLVVFSHLPIMERKFSPDRVIPDWFWIGISGVDLFFVISGFIMVYVTWTAERNVQNSLKFFYSRATRIYPIYWLIALIVLAVWLFMPAAINYDPAQSSVIKSFLLWPDKAYPMLEVAWTLIHEMYFYIVFAALLLLPRRFLLPALCLWMIGVVAGNLAGLTRVSPEFRVIFNALTLEFFLGAVAGLAFKSFGPRWPVILAAIGGAVFALMMIRFAQAPASFAFTQSWVRAFFFGLPGALLVFGLAGLDVKDRHAPYAAQLIGDSSYSLYLTHILTLSAIGLIWSRVAYFGPTDNVIAAFVMVGGAIIGGLVTWYAAEKPLLTAARRGRNKLFPAR